MPIAPVYIHRDDSNTRSPLLHPALGSSLGRSFGLSSPFSLSTLSSSLTALSSSPGRIPHQNNNSFNNYMGMSLGRSFEDRPKLEAQFFRNFSCCGLDLQDLHGLLEHFEECHVAFEEGVEGAESGMDVDMEMDDGNSEGTISGPPSPRAPPGQAPRSIYEMKKSALSSVDGGGTSAPSSPATHLDGGMELDMDMGDTPATYESTQHTISISSSTNLTSNSITPSSSYPPPMSAFDSSSLAGGSNKKKFSAAMNAHPLGSNMRGLAMGGLMGLEALSSYSTPESSVPGTPVMEETPGGGVDGLFSVGIQITTSPSSNLVSGGALAPSLLFPSSASSSSSTATGALDSPHSDSGSNRDGSNSPPESKESTPVFKILGPSSLAPLPPLKTHSLIGDKTRSSSNHHGTIAILSRGSSSHSKASTSSSVDKPFRCGVVGCDKSYKQQNGLKYHRLQGHCSNEGKGMDTKIAKPYVCHSSLCAKRYKNMNGLRYHYQHAGAHGNVGLSMLAQSCHPPPQLTKSKQRSERMNNVGHSSGSHPTRSQPVSRQVSPIASSRAGSIESVEEEQYSEVEDSGTSDGERTGW